MAGYEKYEISAFAREGHRCLHNLNYWKFGDYLAVGAGAHGKLTDDEGVVWRYRKAANPLAYINEAESGDCTDVVTRVKRTDFGFEFMLNALRLTDGFSEADFCDRTGLEADAILGQISRAQSEGLIEQTDPFHWRPTETGFRFLNDLQARFLP
jgi:oxygen-independent coproporphyrinogen-3 oxidase